MRLFIAINFTDETKTKLLKVIDSLKAISRKGNFTKRENLHLTLVFLGECPPQKVSAIKQVIESVSFTPFTICFDIIGKFTRDGGDIYWIGVQRNDILQSLQKDLNDRLLGKGFEIERREYKPHITLGREVVVGSAPLQVEPFTQEVSGIDLMKSDRVNGVLVYSRL